MFCVALTVCLGSSLVVCVGSLVGFSVVVPSASPASPTTILPCISGCSSQWYGTVPDPSNNTSMEYPGCNTPVSNAPLSAVAVCGSLSLLTNLTVVPGATLSWAGLKAWSRISTVIALLGAGGVVLSAGVVVVSPGTTAG